MTIFTFQYPAKIFQSETIPPRAKYRTFQHNGYTVLCFDKGGLFWDTKTNKIKYQTFESDVNEYWIESEGFAVRLRTHSDDDSIRGTIDHFDDMPERLAAMLHDIKNPQGYEERAALAIAERQAEREKEDQARQDKAAWHELHNQAELENAAFDFRRGGMISAEHFETLLKLHGVKIHIRTLGTIRNRVNMIGTGEAKTYGQGFLPDSIWIAARELSVKLAN